MQFRILYHFLTKSAATKTTTTTFSRSSIELLRYSRVPLTCVPTTTTTNIQVNRWLFGSGVGVGGRQSIDATHQNDQCCASSSSSAAVLAQPNQLLFVQKRFKKKFGKKSSKKTSAREEEELDEEDEDSDDDSDDDDVLDENSEDTKVMNATVISMRLDALGKTCFNVARAKFEESFYQGKIRVNGERVGKKSYEVREGDELDLIKGFNLEKREMLDINRVNILKVDDKAASSGRIRLTYRKTNKLVVSNYERDPYELAI